MKAVVNAMRRMISNLAYGACFTVIVLVSHAEFEPFFFIQSADTQLTGSVADRLRFEQMVTLANTIQPDFSVICGDLVNTPNQASYDTFLSIFNGYAQPCHLTPGNHDIWPEQYPDATVEKFKARFGPDYYVFVHNDCQFMLLNSVTLRNPVRYASEYEQQWTWIETQFSTTTLFRQRFIIFHHPPFTSTPDESADSMDCCGPGYWNWPIPERQRLVNLIASSPTETIALCGHLHRNRYLRSDALDISIVSGTQVNFDRPSARDLEQIKKDYDDISFLQEIAPPGFSGNMPRYAFALWKVYSDGLQVFLCDVVNPDTTPPAAPVLALVNSGTLEWEPPADNTGVLWYEVYRNGVLVQKILDVRYPTQQSGDYSVVAIDPAGNRSSLSNIVPVTTAAVHWLAYP